MDIECWVVIERRKRWKLVGIEMQIVLAGILPPRINDRFAVASAMSVVVQPQTEAGSSQSKWPDFRVLSMTADGCSQPLFGEMVSHLRVGPLIAAVLVDEHGERFVPAIVGRNHRPNT